MNLQDISVETPLGEFHMLVQNESGKDVVRASGFGATSELVTRLGAPGAVHIQKLPGVHPYAGRVLRYFAGDLAALQDIPTAQNGSAFFTEVWRAMQTIPAGKTWTYRQLAVAVGNPDAVRAAGTACGRNKIILIVPCHRIVRSDGGLGGYVYGPKLKQALLAHEARYATQR